MCLRKLPEETHGLFVACNKAAYGVTSQHHQSPNGLEGYNSRHGSGVARHSKNSVDNPDGTRSDAYHLTWDFL